MPVITRLTWTAPAPPPVRMKADEMQEFQLQDCSISTDALGQRVVERYWKDRASAQTFVDWATQYGPVSAEIIEA